MTILFSNNASTTISGSITALDLTVALAAGSGVIFPHPTGGNYFVCTFYDQQTKTINEIVHVTNITGDVATIVRAQEGTTAKAWNTGDIFANLITAGTLDAFVQAGVGPADTSIVYVGTDVGTPNHIIATTNPVPSNLAIGMLFNIKVANANTMATDMALNGGPAILIKRTDGSDFERGAIYSGLEYTFVYNGVTFSSTIMNVTQRPPQMVFYVRSDSTSTIDTNGIESNTGLANTPQDSFKSIQGAINTIQLRYVSTTTVKIMVADGVYVGGGHHNSQYITGFEIQGNDANPGNCVIDCTPYSLTNYVKGCGTVAFFSEVFGNLLIHGFTIKSYSQNVAAYGGKLEAYNCHFTSPIGPTGAITSSVAGHVIIWGTCQYTSTNSSFDIFESCYSATLSLGITETADSPARNLDWTYSGSAGVTCVFHSYNSAVISVCNNPGQIAVHGSIPGVPEYYADTGAGIGYFQPVGAGLFATSPGQTTGPGWANNGNG
jgi:hypothetical protein